MHDPSSWAHRAPWALLSSSTEVLRAALLLLQAALLGAYSVTLPNLGWFTGNKGVLNSLQS